MKEILYVLWSFRYFILSSIRTEFRSRFARSKLGGLWMILNPLAMVLIYTLVLSQIMSAKLPNVSTIYAYPIYILSGMVAWTLFSEVFSRSLNIFIDNGNLIKKMNFPKLALPLIAMGTSLVNFFFLLVTMFIVMMFLGHYPTNVLYWLPILILLTSGLGLGIGLFFGILNVFIRDIGQILNIVLQFWFWLTPVVYMTSIIPDKYHWLIMLNPMTGLVMSYHKVLLYNSSPDLSLLIYPSVITCISLILALIMFKKANEEMADLL
ncbi:ABC transporter permease [Vibrio rhizosphaerae]|uniref:Transport permease protein n=1 Tax=Vibrio rhizosphaerae TaxID=398736 RepID=A0ABU4IQ84_9VIBR|nr:ABC transporter permease [Vibrio rhizosphaerae]MDW6091560.1 ABC transporter permease [Vibrio rhizosphaerae]